MTTNKKKRQQTNKENGKTPGKSGGFVALKKNFSDGSAEKGYKGVNGRGANGRGTKGAPVNRSKGAAGNVTKGAAVNGAKEVTVNGYKGAPVNRSKGAAGNGTKNSAGITPKGATQKTSDAFNDIIMSEGKRARYGKLPELLAPAGSPKALWAAIAAGADAVYFALPDFNARINADNFTRESFAESVRLCHLHGVKAYITLNTQIYDREKRDFLEAALFAYRSGVDAAIVGDLGCASLIKKYIPCFELHASTQLSGHNAAAGRELQKLGFTRMVCAREMPLGDIKNFVKDSPIEAEIFVHGALCVCHSGQCLFSSLVGGRSGNRGLCAQPCRLPYKSSDDGASGYHLSLKDACLASHVPEIIESGVASLKIEGRMKGAEYVFGVVSIYRRLLDERRAATNEEIAELQAIFSRGGLTDAYFTSRVSHKMLGVRSEKDKELSRAASESKELKLLRRVGVKLNVKIRRDEPMKLTLSLDEAAKNRFGRELTATVFGETPFAAQSRPTDEETAKKNLIKFGSTQYEATEISIELDDGLMIPVSALNSLRRKGSEALDEAILSNYKKREKLADGYERVLLEADSICIDPSAKRFAAFNEKSSECDAKCDAENPSYDRTAFFARAKGIPLAAREYFDIVFLSATEFTDKNKDAIEHLRVNGIALPPVVFDSEAATVEEHLSTARTLGVRYALVGNLGHLALAEKYGFEVVGDFRLNVSNSETARSLISSFPFSSVILSPELTLPRIKTIAGAARVGVTVYGRVPLMIVEKCVISELHPCGYAINGGDECKTCASDSARLVDRTGAAFPVLREFLHRNVIYNSLPTYMADKLDTLPDEAICFRHFIFSTESADEAARVIEAYKNGARSDLPIRRLGV